MKELRIDFVDFWPNFHKKDNYFYHLLSQEYLVKIDEVNPDIVFGSYGYDRFRQIEKYKDHRSLKIFFTGENDGPRGGPYDVNMTQHRCDSENHMRIPLWAFFTSWFDEVSFVHNRDPSFLTPWKALDKRKVDLESIVDAKKRFCCFVYADLTTERKKWFDAIKQLEEVDAAGKCLNNTGGSIPGRGDQIYKLAFLSEYFFSLAVENSCVNGYSTEKLLHPMSMLTIPMYWGDPNVHEDINIDSVIDLRKDPKDVIDELRMLVSNKRNYIDKLSIPWFNIDHSKRYREDTLKFIKNSAMKKGITL
jgi:hypothetical protein